MSSGGTTTNPANNTAQIHGGATVTHHRRRVADAMNDQEKEKPTDQVPIALDHSKSDVDDEALFNNSNSNGVVYQYNSLHHHHHPVIRYLLSRKRVPENWVLWVEECLLSAWGVFNSLTSRKNMGRTVFMFLLVMVVVSAFLKFYFLIGAGGVAGGKIVRTEKEILFIQNFKNDLLSNAHMAVFDSESSSGAALQKRQMKEFPVS